MTVHHFSPFAIPAAGTAQVSVTLPAGVPDGTHRIFAVGSGIHIEAVLLQLFDDGFTQGLFVFHN